VIHAHVLEFQSAWSKPTAGEAAWFIGRSALVAGLALGAVRIRELRARALLCLVLAVFATLHTRHVELAGLVAAVLLSDHLTGADRSADESDAASGRRHALLGLAIVPGLLLGLAANARARRERSDDDWISARLGGSAIARLARELPSGAHAYVPFLSAGLVLDHEGPRGVRVFYDSRNDCYTAEVAEEFFAIEHGQAGAGAIAILARRGADAALLPRGHPLEAALEDTGSWMRRDDGDWSLWLTTPHR
jgi:hypothetical protein